MKTISYEKVVIQGRQPIRLRIDREDDVFLRGYVVSLSGAYDGVYRIIDKSIIRSRVVLVMNMRYAELEEA